MRGLRFKPTYEDLIGEAVSYKLHNVKFPNRDAKFLREVRFIAIRWRGDADYASTTRNDM